MKTYNDIPFHRISEMLTQAALGVAAVCDCKFTIPDMVCSLSDFSKEACHGLKEPYYIAIREMGTESGNKEHCLDFFMGKIVSVKLNLFYKESNILLKHIVKHHEVKCYYKEDKK